MNPSHTVLLLDADPATRAELVALTRELDPGFKILEASSIDAALGALKSNTVDLMVADTRTPTPADAGILQALARITSIATPKALFVVSATVDEFEITVDLPTAILHTFTLNPDVYQKNLAEHFGLKLPPRKAAQVRLGDFDVEFMNHFLEATTKILATFGKTQCQREGLFLKGPSHSSGDISATMIIEGATHRGSFSIALEETTFCAVATAVMGTPVAAISETYRDIASEICNQVFGKAKVTLNALGHEIKQEIPSVRIGKAHSVAHTVPGPCVAVRLSTPSGKLQIEAVLQPK